MHSVTVRRENSQIYLINNETQVGFAFTSWLVADAFAHAVAYKARHLLPGNRDQITRQVAVRCENDEVIVEFGNAVFLIVPNKAALDLANAILSHARQIEEIETAEATAFDQAVLIRSGVLPGLGLTGNPDIQKEAIKEAAHNQDLRRYLPFGIKHQQHVGAPNIVKENED